MDSYATEAFTESRGEIPGRKPFDNGRGREEPALGTRLNIERITDRIDAITLIRPEQLQVAPPAPRSVKIELTQRCNYRCAFCALQFRENSTTDLDWNLFRRITQEMREAGVVEIAPFYIGESFTDPKRLVAAITWLKRDLETPYVFLTTNGSLANPDVTEQCMKAGLDSLKFSVTSANEEDFKEVVRVTPRFFRKAINNIEHAREIRDKGGYKTRLYASSIEYHGEQHARMKALLEQDVIPYVDQHYWLPLYTFGAMTHHTTEDMNYQPTPGNMGRIGALRDPLPCWCVFTEGHVCADGMLSACGFDATSQYTVADLNKVSFMEGWHSSTFQELRAAHLRKDVKGTVCEDCALYKK